MLSKFQLSDLQMVNHSTQPVVLKFTADWCRDAVSSHYYLKALLKDIQMRFLDKNIANED